MKCNRIVDDTREPFLMYAKNIDEALDGKPFRHPGLQDAIKEHDVLVHPDDHEWPKFKVLVFYPKK